MAKSSIRVGLVGAGYIASWHAGAVSAAPDAVLTAVCDRSGAAAKALADSNGVPAFTDLAEMLAADVCDVVHVLTPPDSHAPIAQQCVEAGLDVLMEKPAAPKAEDLRAVLALADQKGRKVAVCHNFLGLPGYTRLKAARDAGQLGRVAQADINWHFPLAPLRSGPFGLWMLREQKNLLLELGPHLFAFAVDLFGPLEILHVSVGKMIDLPGGLSRPQSWRIIARAGDVDVNLTLSLVETFDDRSVTLRGSAGMAKLDFANDTLVIDRDNTSDIVLNQLKRQTGLARQAFREGWVNAVKQVRSLNRKTPYGLSFANTVNAFYDSVRKDRPVPQSIGADAVHVLQGIEDAVAMLPPETPVAVPEAKDMAPDVMVIGGTGFIGRALTRAWVAKGHQVRVLSRGRTGPFADIADMVEITPCDLSDTAAMTKAMAGIKIVYHLGKSTDDTWEDALKNDVGVTVAIAEAALAAGVDRFVYTGTIASYDMSNPLKTITEDTGFPADMTDRNIYARSKARCELELTRLHKEKGLPLVIARPGIVVGEGGPLQHWGIGRWHGAGAVRIWGPGNNILPFVLIDDVADGLVLAAEKDAALGRSFNLVGPRLLSAKGYFRAIHTALGADIKVSSGNLNVLHVTSTIKHVLKKYGLRKKGLSKPSLADWKSRAHFAPFDNTQSVEVLGWQPESDKEKFIEKAITKANLFGF